MGRIKLDAWWLYLVIAVCFSPMLVPPGPGRTAFVDPLNAVALGLWVLSRFASKRPVSLPLFVPMLVIAVASTVATFNAPNPGAAILTLIQDAYLYVYFVMLADLMSDRSDFRGLRLAWVAAACVIAMIGIYQAVMLKNPSVMNLISPRGFRALGTFDQPDTLSDYLVFSIFIALSLNEEAGRWVRWGAIAIMGLGIVGTKANGGVGSVAGGLIAWAIVRAWTKRVSYAGLVAGVLIVVSVGILSFWLIEGTGVASHEIQALETKSFLGRVGHSSEGRMHIWKALWRRFSKTPLGYGPGNSRWQVLTIEERDRPLKGPTETFDSGADPFASKEAHNDYLAYLMERGPVALAAMLIMKLLVFGRITRWWRDRAASAPGRARGGAIAAAMFGAWVGSWINSNTIETLHFRHVWVFLAMVYGLRAVVTAPAPATSVASERERPALAGAHAVALP